MSTPGPRGIMRALAARRRYRRLLRSLDHDPDASPVTEAGPRDFVICGCPRTGTTYLAAALFQPPAVVTVVEPWDGLASPPAAVMRTLRDELEAGVLRSGRLDVEAAVDRREVLWCRDGERPVAVEASADTVVAVKWPAWWRYVSMLTSTRFIVCLRDPAETVESMAGAGGRLAEGFEYDVTFNRRMNDHLAAATRDPAIRRVLFYDYVHERLLPHLDAPNVLTVRYDRWESDPAAQWAEVTRFLGVDLPGPLVPFGTVDRRPTSATRAVVTAECRTASRLGYS